MLHLARASISGPAYFTLSLHFHIAGTFVMIPWPVRVRYNSTYRRYKKAGEDFMDPHRSGQMDEHNPPYIWLRYSTEFTSGGRSHTIEMQIPVPVGASAEQREQLIREAEAGIEQLYRQIERRGSQRNQQSPETGRPQEAAQRSRTDYASSRQPAPVDARPTPPAPPVVPTRQPVQSSPPQQVATQAATRDASKIISYAVFCLKKKKIRTDLST